MLKLAVFYEKYSVKKLLRGITYSCCSLTLKYKNIKSFGVFFLSVFTFIEENLTS